VVWCGQVCLAWDAEDSAEDDVTAFQLLVDGAPVGEPLQKRARQVAIDQLKPGQELDVSLVPLDAQQQPLGSSNVVKARPRSPSMLVIVAGIYRPRNICRHIMRPPLTFDPLS